MSEFVFFIIGSILGSIAGIMCMCLVQINRIKKFPIEVRKMRKRDNQILFRLDDEEADYLDRLVKRSGRSRESLIRAVIKGYQLCEKPDPEFYKTMRELSAIGNRINQLAAKANALNYVDTPMLQQESKKWHQLQIDIRKKYLLPRKEIQ